MILARRAIFRAISAPKNAIRRAGLSSKTASSNPPMLFPCLDRMDQKNEQLSCTSTVPLMANTMESGPEPSYSYVQTGFEVFKSLQPLDLDWGGVLPEYDIAYETWGRLNAAKDNAILIHTGLSALSHAKSQPNNQKLGWWEEFIGLGKYIDTDRYFVICTNVLGGCYGSTGPLLPDPGDGKPYATRFPILTVNDMVRAQRELVVLMGIKKLHASVGASMGGMQSLAYAWEFPNEVEKVISISGCARLHPYSIALRHCQRQVLMLDPNWKRGYYYGLVPPHFGMKLAREIATVTYRLGPEWEYRFGRNRADSLKPPALCPDFLVETYLDHAGEKFCLEYDANSWLYVLKAMDLFDLGFQNRDSARIRRLQRSELGSSLDLLLGAGVGVGQFPTDHQALIVPETRYEEKPETQILTQEESLIDLKKGMEKIAHKSIMVVGVESDILFPVWQQREIADVLKEADKGGDIRYFELGLEVSNYGHDTFLLLMDHFGPPVKDFLET